MMMSMSVVYSHLMIISQVPTWIMKELAVAISSPQPCEGFSQSDLTPSSRPASSMDIEVIDSSSTHTLADTHSSAAPPAKPCFFIPEANVQDTSSVEEGSIKPDSFLRLPAPVRRVSGSTRKKPEPLRLPTPHNRLKSALSANSIDSTSTTSPTSSSGPGISSKILNIKKASSNTDLINRSTRPALSKQPSVPKVQSGLVQVSSSVQQNQSGGSSPKLVDQDSHHHPLLVKDKAGKEGKFPLQTPDTRTSSTDSLDKTSLYYKGSNHVSHLLRLYVVCKTGDL